MTDEEILAEIERVANDPATIAAFKAAISAPIPRGRPTYVHIQGRQVIFGRPHRDPHSVVGRKWERCRFNRTVADDIEARIQKCIVWLQAERKHLRVIDGRPRFAKPSIDDGKKVKNAAIDPDFDRGHKPLSLMEYADRVPISHTHSKCSDYYGVSRSRSDLSRHHVMIACAIGGGTPFEVGCRYSLRRDIHGDGSRMSLSTGGGRRGGYPVFMPPDSNVLRTRDHAPGAPRSSVRSCWPRRRLPRSCCVVPATYPATSPTTPYVLPPE